MKTGDARFPGFPAGKLKAVWMPALFFAELLPVIDNLAELKVTLHVFWLLSQRNRELGGVSLSELSQDTLLLKGLSVQDEDGRTLLRTALDQAVKRGTLLKIRTSPETGGDQEWFFLNSERGRDKVASIRHGEVDMGGEVLPQEAVEMGERPNIFVLYEQNIGLLQPLIVEELQEAENLYPVSWIEEAFTIAVERNARNWRYVRAILERWRDEGRGDEESGRDYREDGRSYLTGKYSDIIKH